MGYKSSDKVVQVCCMFWVSIFAVCMEKCGVHFVRESGMRLLRCSCVAGLLKQEKINYGMTQKRTKFL